MRVARFLQGLPPQANAEELQLPAMLHAAASSQTAAARIERHRDIGMVFVPAGAGGASCELMMLMI
jgi:hypothetical protein